MNKIHVIGRQTADPVLKTVNNVSVAEFTVAANTKTKGENDEYVSNFYRCSVWRGLGETCAKYLKKGNRVGLVGDLLFRTYTNTQGQDRAQMQVTVNDIEFLSDKKNSTENTETTPAQNSQNTSEASDDLPF